MHLEGTTALQTLPTLKTRRFNLFSLFIFLAFSLIQFFYYVACFPVCVYSSHRRGPVVAKVVKQDLEASHRNKSPPGVTFHPHRRHSQRQHCQLAVIIAIDITMGSRNLRVKSILATSRRAVQVTWTLRKILLNTTGMKTRLRSA